MIASRLVLLALACVGSLSASTYASPASLSVQEAETDIDCKANPSAFGCTLEQTKAKRSSEASESGQEQHHGGQKSNQHHPVAKRSVLAELSSTAGKTDTAGAHLRPSKLHLRGATAGQVGRDLHKRMPGVESLENGAHTVAEGITGMLGAGKGESDLWHIKTSGADTFEVRKIPQGSASGSGSQRPGMWDSSARVQAPVYYHYQQGPLRYAPPPSAYLSHPEYGHGRGAWIPPSPPPYHHPRYMEPYNPHYPGHEPYGLYYGPPPDSYGFRSTPYLQRPPADYPPGPASAPRDPNMGHPAEYPFRPADNRPQAYQPMSTSWDESTSSPSVTVLQQPEAFGKARVENADPSAQGSVFEKGKSSGAQNEAEDAQTRHDQAVKFVTAPSYDEALKTMPKSRITEPAQVSRATESVEEVEAVKKAAKKPNPEFEAMWQDAPKAPVVSADPRSERRPWTMETAPTGSHAEAKIAQLEQTEGAGEANTVSQQTADSPRGRGRLRRWNDKLRRSGKRLLRSFSALNPGKLRSSRRSTSRDRGLSPEATSPRAVSEEPESPHNVPIDGGTESNVQPKATQTRVERGTQPSEKGSDSDSDSDLPIHQHGSVKSTLRAKGPAEVETQKATIDTGAGVGTLDNRGTS